VHKKRITDNAERYLCDRYKVGDFNTEELIEFYEELRRDNPGFHFLVTIDNLNQAEYTSMHARLTHDLDAFDARDVSKFPEICFEDGEHIGYLLTQDEFFVRKRNFLRLAEKAKEGNFLEKNLRLSEGFEGFIEGNKDLVNITDETLLILKVPVEKPCQLIGAFANGYFSGDLNPFENYMLAKHMKEHFDYELFGIGASFIVFIRNRILDVEKRQVLVDLLFKMYWNEYGENYWDEEGEKPVDEFTFREFLDQTIQNNSLLVLRYTE